MMVTVMRALIVLTVAGLALVSQLQWSGATRPDRGLQEQPRGSAHLDLGVRAPQQVLSRGSRIPEPTYPEVAYLEALQAEKAAAGCPTDRLLAAEAVSGFDNLLLTLQSGLSIGAWPWEGRALPPASGDARSLTALLAPSRRRHPPAE